MIDISGYYRSEPLDNQEMSEKFVINSAGHYRLVERKLFKTVRPQGRPDYQLLYIARGTVHFLERGEYREIGEGNMYLYYSGEPQCYYYELETNPEIYWIHFSGTEVEEYLQETFSHGSGFYHTGGSKQYELIFTNIIRELQLQRAQFLEMSKWYFLQMLTAIRRSAQELLEANGEDKAFMQSVILYLYENYNQPIVIKELAGHYHLTENWFIRKFQAATGYTPKNYLQGIRMDKAKELLLSGACNVAETALSLGYQDPFYFSRIFRKMVGISPSDYQKANGRSTTTSTGQ